MTDNLPVPDDLPYLNLSQSEIDELRKNKNYLTEYGKQRLRELMRNQEPYPDEFFEEAERREKSNRILQRYNDFHNLATSAFPWGIITPEHQQIIAMESMIDAIRCEYLNREYNHIAIEDIEGLIEGLRNQADEFLERVKTLSANVETPENTEND
jgi:hypothetical protein